MVCRGVKRKEELTEAGETGGFLLTAFQSWSSQGKASLGKGKGKGVRYARRPRQLLDRRLFGKSSLLVCPKARCREVEEGRGKVIGSEAGKRRSCISSQGICSPQTMGVTEGF